MVPLLLLLLLLSSPLPSVHTTSNVTTVSVSLLPNPGAPVAPNFVGLSIEVPAVLKMIGERGDSAPLATLLNHWSKLSAGAHAGPTLRFGGNSADDSGWSDDPAAPHPAGISYAITSADLDAYAAFASTTAAEANVSLIIDTNFGTTPDPTRFGVPHVKAVVGHPNLLPYVSAVEVGNEVDLFVHEKPGHAVHRNTSYTEAEYEVEWGRFVDAYEDASKGGLPKGMIQAATYAEANHEWGSRLNTLLTTWKGHLASVSLHRYATSTCSGTPVTRADLLSDEATRGKGTVLSYAYYGELRITYSYGALTCGVFTVNYVCRLL